MPNITNKTKNSLAQKAIFIFGFLIFLYTTYKAYILSITWDEGQSYIEYIRNNIFILQAFDTMSANNHLLTTLSGMFFTKYFGISEFSLRISSLIAHLFFIVYSAKLVLKFENKWIAFSAFLILNLNPFMLDFFSLARGYSISIGFMMVSVYYLYQLLYNNYKTKYAIFSIIFSLIATLGNLTVLNYSVVLFGVIALLLFYNNYKTYNKLSLSISKTAIQLLIPSILLILALWFILPYSFNLRAAGALFMGGENGLWKDTLGTIVPRLWYGLDFSYWLQRLTKFIFLLIIASSIIFVGLKHYKKNVSPQNMFLSSLLTVFLLIIIATVVQHYLLGTLFLIERAVLFLYVLLMLVFVFLINQLYKEKQFFRYLIHTFSTLVFVHFFFSFNLKYVYEWKEDCETNEMLLDLEKIKIIPSEKFNVTIGVPLPMESSINYYRNVNNLNWLNQARRSKTLNYLDDYFFLRPQDLTKTNIDSLEIIKIYPTTKNILAKPKYPFKEHKIVFDSIITLSSNTDLFNQTSEMEYSPGFNIFINENYPKQNSLLSFKLDFKCLNKLSANVYIIVSFENKDGMYLWLNGRVNDFFKNPNVLSYATYTSIIPTEIKNGDQLKMYIWNPNKQDFFIEKMELRWINYFNK